MTTTRRTQPIQLSGAAEPDQKTGPEGYLVESSAQPGQPGKKPYSAPVLTRHGKVTDLTLGGSPSTLDLESDGSIGRFGTPKN